MSDVRALEPLQRQCQKVSAEEPVAHSANAEHNLEMQNIAATGHQADTQACGLSDMSASRARYTLQQKVRPPPNVIPVNVAPLLQTGALIHHPAARRVPQECVLQQALQVAGVGCALRLPGK